MRIYASHSREICEQFSNTELHVEIKIQLKKEKNKPTEKKLSNLWFHKVDSFSLHNVFMGVNHTVKEQLWYESYNGNLTVTHFLWLPALQGIQKKCIPAWTTPELPAMPLIQKLIMINSELIISQSCFWRYLYVFFQLNAHFGTFLNKNLLFNWNSWVYIFMS